MRLAVQGCGHGDLNAIYARLAELELQTMRKADLLIVCGDFQAIRHGKDLKTLACPPKYQRMGDFCEYYSGRRKAPLPTLFIGGNHEASGHLWELYHGGWVAPNLYFLGYSGVIKFGGLRIGGISGIHDGRHSKLGYYERLPYDDDSMRSIYHTREFEVEKLSLLKEKLDVFISHEWPHKVYEHGDLKGLLRRKPFFRKDIEGAGIGAKPLTRLLSLLKPSRWFAAHMHVEFEASVSHSDGSSTQFVALDKCLPRRNHLRIFDIPSNDDLLELEYDPEWLAIIRAMNPWMNLNKSQTLIPKSVDLKDHHEFVEKLKDANGRILIPKKYIKPADVPGRRTTLFQTAAFCKLLGMRDHWHEPPTNASIIQNPEEIRLE
jgi:lariat debranching enzyme